MKKLINTLKIFNIIIFLSLSLNLFCQTDERADNILNQFSEKTKKFNTIIAKFTFRQFTHDEGEVDNFDGEIYIKDNQYKLTFPGNEIYSNGKTLWQYMIDLNEVTITNKEKDDDSFLNNPKKIFSIYKEEFKYKFNREFSENGEQFYEIDLFPKKIDESTYSRLRLIINKNNLQLISIEYFGKDANRFLIEIDNFLTNESLEENFFKFIPENYPGIEISDMR
ncbi:MAG: outer membrane lipoprotein carrier protein LolA [Bacteroidales bacterium]|nr:outer membrane lipoprotein carrier protein LolA [Bacteroidales bacterium]